MVLMDCRQNYLLNLRIIYDPALSLYCIYSTVVHLVPYQAITLLAEKIHLIGISTVLKFILTQSVEILPFDETFAYSGSAGFIRSFNPKKAGSFDPISQPGGGWIPPPPRISAAEGRKIM